MSSRTLLIVPTLALALAACSTSGYEEVVNDEALQETMLPKHVDFDKPGPLQRLISGSDEEQEEKLTDAEQRIARLEQQLQRQQLQRESQPAATPSRAAEHGVLAEKLGLLFTGEAASPALRNTLEQALSAAQADYPVAVVASGSIEEQLAAQGCSREDLSRCGALARYPGTHYVAEIERLEIASPTRAVARMQLHDVLNGASQPAVQLEVPAVDGKVTQLAMRGVADKIVTDVLAAARASQWSTRAFNREGNEIFVAAGQRSGLKPGMVLDVHGEGRVVRSPTGTVAGWIPGPKKGAIRITQLFGDDYAVAELVEGQAPAPTDPLLKAGE